MIMDFEHSNMFDLLGKEQSIDEPIQYALNSSQSYTRTRLVSENPENDLTKIFDLYLINHLYRRKKINELIL